MSAKELESHILKLEAELEVLKIMGVFRLVPVREKRSDGKGEWLAFKRRGAIVIDESVPYVRRISLPLERNENKANQLLWKLERTKEAQALILKIKALKTKLQDQEKNAAKAAQLIAKADAYRQRAALYIKQAAALQSA